QLLSHQLIQYKMQTMSSEAKGRLDEFYLDASKLRSLHHIVLGLFSLWKRTGAIKKLVETFLQANPRTSALNNNSNNYLHNLKQAGFSLSEIASQFNHLYGAFNAIDYSITCALYLLSQHDEWIGRLRAEFSQVLEGQAYPSPQHFPQLVQTMRFMKEVFRTYPVAMTVARRTGKPVRYNDGEIPAGTEVMILLYALHHHPEFWSAPDTFNPDRWASPTPHKSFAYIPFLEGPRQCIGRHWATLNFIVILHALLSHYDFNILKSKVEINRYLIPRFAEKIPCQVYPRVM
ncbi:MAG: cytochrome P450, partial [Cyanobacteria bacterium J06627_32]